VISRFRSANFLTAGGYSLSPIAREKEGLDHRIASLRASLLRAFLEGLRELRYKNIVSERRHAAGWPKTLREILRSCSVSSSVVIIDPLLATFSASPKT